MPFRDVGNRRLAALLARSVARDTLPPSLIFSGPSGADMRQTAIAVAQALNCLEPVGKGDERDSCGTCAACTRIAKGMHPDVLLVSPGDNGRVIIEQIREVIERSGFKPFEGRRRAVIIEETDTMLGPAQSALLKTLEEPPPSSILILVTTRPDMLLATVRSRCPQLRFVSAKGEDVDAEMRGLVTDVLNEVAAGDTVGKLEAARLLLPKSGAGRVERDHVTRNLRVMTSLLRDVAVLSTRADASVLANADVRPDLDRLTKSFGGERGMRAFTAVDTALTALDENANAKIVADWLVLQL